MDHEAKRITRHISVAVSLFERMPEADLRECFPNNPLAEVRAYLAELREQGLTFFPCQCEDHNPDGSCAGFEPE